MATRNYVLQRCMRRTATRLTWETVFPGDEEDEQEAYEQRAEGVENAGRQLAALHKKKGGGD